MDPSFADNGFVRLSLGQQSIASAVIVDPATGKIVVAGSALDAQRGRAVFTVVRFVDDGTLDSTFGINGVTRIGLPDQDCWLEDIGVQSDGRLVGVGGANGTTGQLALVRLSANGALDSTFGTGGMVIGQPQLFGHAVALAIDSADRIVVAAQNWDNSGPTSASRFATVRFLAAGALDSTFGAAFNDHALANDLVLQPDGRILVAGQVDIDQKPAFGVARYADDGSLDPSFGTGGTSTVSFDPGSEALGVALASDGSVFLVGDTADSGGEGGAASRLTGDGVRDTSFGTAGVFIARIVPDGLTFQKATVSSVDGKLLTTGWATTPAGGKLELARFETSGTLDTTFAATGMASFSAGTPWTAGQNLAVQGDGRIVVAGASGDAVSFDFTVARFCP